MTSLPPHVENAAIVLDEVQLAYVPVPKAGSTALLWALHDLVEPERSDFTASTKLEVTRALTIHDLSIWGHDRRLAGRRAGDVDRIFGSADWLAFTVVREPVRRIWSAWVSKILLHDPRFVAAFGGEKWFPEPPRSAEDIVMSFRSFVEGLSDAPDAWHDPHWSSQATLLGVGQIAYDVVGRVEDLPHVIEVVDAHLRARGREGLELRRENPSLVSFVAEALDLDAWERCAAVTADDREVFGYELVPRGFGEPDARWVAEVEARIPVIQAVIERNERIGDLKRLISRRRVS